MRKNSGFSLVELMATVAIIAIVTAITIPGIMSWLPNYRLRKAVLDLEGNIQWTRLQAIKNNQQWAVLFDQANGFYFICSDDGPNDTWDGPLSMGGDGDTVVRTVNLADYNAGVNISAVSNIAFTFSNRGLSGFNNNVNLVHRRGAPIYQINVTISGGVSSTWRNL